MRKRARLLAPAPYQLRCGLSLLARAHLPRQMTKTSRRSAGLCWHDTHRGVAISDGNEFRAVPRTGRQLVRSDLCGPKSLRGRMTPSATLKPPKRPAPPRVHRRRTRFHYSDCVLEPASSVKGRLPGSAGRARLLPRSWHPIEAGISQCWPWQAGQSAGARGLHPTARTNLATLDSQVWDRRGDTFINKSCALGPSDAIRTLALRTRPP